MDSVKSITFQPVGPGGPDIYPVESETGAWLFQIWLTDDGKVLRAIVQPQPGQRKIDMWAPTSGRSSIATHRR